MLGSTDPLNCSGTHVFLTEGQRKKVEKLAFRILEEIGMETTESRSRKLLEQAGADIKNNRVRLPPTLVEDCIDSAPSEIDIYDQKGNLAMELRGDNSYFGASVDAPAILDPFDHEYRECTEKDIAQLAFLLEELSNIGFLSFSGFVSGTPSGTAEKVALRQIMINSNKPIVAAVHKQETLLDIYKMASIVGSGQELRTSPFIINYTEPVSPLVNPENSLRKIIFSSYKNIPVLYSPYLAMGATAPQNKFSALGQGVAESLFGLVVSQLVENNFPFILGAMPSLMDMKTSIFTYGSPEMQFLCSGIVEMAEYFGLPSFGTAGTGDSNTFDGQAILEATSSSYLAVMAGANLIHDSGLFGSGKLVIPEMFVVMDEIIEMLRYSLGGIDGGEENVYIDLLKEVGPKGEFVSSTHTASNFREVWYPTLMDRSPFEIKKQNYETFEERTKEKLRNIFKKQTQKEGGLSDDVVNKLKQLEKE